MSMRFGLIGYGLWGRHHARAIAKAPGATLAAIACRTPETAEVARKDWPEATVELDYRALLARENVDVVDIVVPNDLHDEIGVAALEAGKDVLLEKPLAPTLAACDRLIETARRSGRVLSVGHELRLSEQWGAIKHIVDRGDLGDLRCVTFNLFRFPYRPGTSPAGAVRSR
jgi:myo-inositol 2-dehydrogenase/D-chiro-inositol 1-dehydrogenase